MNRTILLTTLFVVIVAVSTTQATLIEIAITAEVTDVYDPEDFHLEGNVKIGDTITGSYKYDSDATDTNPSSSGGLYEFTQSPCGIFLEAGGLFFKTDPSDTYFLVSIGDDTPPNAFRDTFNITSYSNLSLSNDVPVGNISWQLIDYSATAFINDSLPLLPPVLENWDFNDLFIEGGMRSGDFMIHGEVTSAVLIPEPASIIFIGLGCLGIFKAKKLKL